MGNSMSSAKVEEKVECQGTSLSSYILILFLRSQGKNHCASCVLLKVPTRTAKQVTLAPTLYKIVVLAGPYSGL
jgi:hypothetical protein